MRKRTFINFVDFAPVICKSDGTEGDGADTSVHHVMAGPHSLELRYEQTNSDIIPVRVVDTNSCNGWQIPLDDTDNDGIEIGLGILPDANAAHCFKVGTDPAFMFEVELGIPVVADLDVCAIGFRTTLVSGGTNAYEDAINSVANLLGAYSPATGHKFLINIEQGDYHVQKTTNGTDAEDDVSVTDAANDDTPKLCVKVGSTGAVSAYVDGSAVTLTNAGTAFDIGDLVVPFMVLAKDASAGSADTPPILKTLYCGYQ